MQYTKDKAPKGQGLCKLLQSVLHRTNVHISYHSLWFNNLGFQKIGIFLKFHFDY